MKNFLFVKAYDHYSSRYYDFEELFNSIIDYNLWYFTEKNLAKFSKFQMYRAKYDYNATEDSFLDDIKKTFLFTVNIDTTQKVLKIISLIKPNDTKEKIKIKFKNELFETGLFELGHIMNQEELLSLFIIFLPKKIRYILYDKIKEETGYTIINEFNDEITDFGNEFFDDIFKIYFNSTENAEKNLKEFIYGDNISYLTLLKI